MSWACTISKGAGPARIPKTWNSSSGPRPICDLRQAEIAAFGSTRKARTPVEQDPQVAMLLACDTPVVTIFGKTWTLHVTDVLRTTLKENVAMIDDTVAYLKQTGKEVIYDAEHFFDG